MYGVLPAVCCCEEPGPPPPGTEYYVFTPCDYFLTYCCTVSPSACDDAPEQIIWCQWYATAQGLTYPIPEGQCVLIKWSDCCIYELSGIVDDPCPSPPGSGQNVGTLFETYEATEERPCCTPEPVDTNEEGCIYDQSFDEEHPWTPAPCKDLIAVEYDKYDQWGTVIGKEVKVRADFTYCYATIGIPHDVPCDHGSPIVHQQASVSHEELVGLCEPVDGGFGNCENQRTEVFVEYLTCPECNPTASCCGGSDPCEGLSPGDPAYDEACEDPANTYSIKTCYRVNNCLDDDENQVWFEEDVLYIDFPWCHSGIDPDAEDVQDQLDAFYIDPVSGVVRVDVTTLSTVWDPSNYPVTLLEVCNYDGYIMSGNAKNIADSINAHIGDLVTATSIAPWDEHIWFNRRQTCTQCDAFDLVIPPYSEGDELVVDRVEPLPDGPRVYLVGRSRKKYVCTSKTLESVWSVAFDCFGSSDVVTTAISATGNADDGFNLHCLSPAEYSSGLRYSMRRIEQQECLTDICIDLNTSLSVPKCQELVGGLNYPEADWDALCLNVLGPTQIKCRSYFHVYSVTPCDGEIPILCIAPSCSGCDSYQNEKAFCETDGSVIEVL